MNVQSKKMKNFRVGDLFDIKPTKTCYLSGCKGQTPVLSNTSSNNGIKYYAIEQPVEKGNIVTFSDTTDSALTVFYQESDFIGFSHVQGMHPKIYKNMWNKNCYLYFIAAFKHAMGTNFSYANKFNREIASDVIVQLPIDNNDVIDWQYMAERIEELEAERIEELEAYLAVTGLDDYELTDEDKEVLSLSTKSAFEENGDNANVAKNEIEFREFRIGDLFEKLPLKNKSNFNKTNDISQIQTREFDLPLVNAKHGNNGIMYYGRSTEYKSAEMTLGVVNDGAISAGDVYPHPENTGVLYNAYLIKPYYQKINREILEYLSCIVKKAIKTKFGYDNKATWEKVQSIYISVPVLCNRLPNHTYTIDDIDFDYMERYIRAIEKQTIASIYEGRGKIIEKIKEIVD